MCIFVTVIKCECFNNVSLTIPSVSSVVDQYCNHFCKQNQYDLLRITLECNLFDNITYFPCHWKPNRISCEISQNIDWQSWQLFTVFLDRVLKNTLNPISLVMFLHKNKSIFKVAIKNFLFLILRRTPANKWYIKKYIRLQ